MKIQSVEYRGDDFGLSGSASPGNDGDRIPANRPGRQKLFRVAADSKKLGTEIGNILLLLLNSLILQVLFILLSKVIWFLAYLTNLSYSCLLSYFFTVFFVIKSSNSVI